MAFLEEYTLLDELGQGGYATVYKVRHNNLGYIRAIRVLNAIIAHGETDKTYQKFLEECRLLLRLGNGNHPNIVHIYQPLLKAQRAIVEMDFVDGKDLYHYLEEKHSFVEIKDVLKLLTDISSALAYCHEDIYKFCMDKDEDGLQDNPDDGRKVLLDDKTKKRLINKYRVIHNDIHSGNIIRREDGSYVLLDFGLAIEGDSVVRSSRRKNGAPEFKAPEKWDNDSILTTQSDIYSFGVVLYEYLAGRVPFLFDKKNPNSVEAEFLLSKAHKEQQPASIFELRKSAFENSHVGETYEKDYPDWLEKLIMKCLAKSTKDRFKNGKELYSFVLKHLGDETERQIENLKQEIDTLQHKIASLESVTNIPSKEVDKLVLDLQEQLKDVLQSKERLRKKIADLQRENTELKRKSPDNEESRNKIVFLENQLKNITAEFRSATEKISTITNKNRKLQEENINLRNNNVGKVWKILTVIFLLIASTTTILYLNRKDPSDTITVLMDDGIYASFDKIEIKSIIAERDSLTKQNTRLKGKISTKDSRISELSSINEDLDNENSSLKSNHAKYFQNTIDSMKIEIVKLESSIKQLKEEKKEKDRLINVLNAQIGVN